MSWLTHVAQFLFVARKAGVSARRAAAGACVIVVVGVGAAWGTLTPWDSVPNDGHALICFEMAVNRALFGVGSHLYSGPNRPIQELAKDGPGVLDVPVRLLPSLVCPSPEEYRAHLRPCLHNENTLMLLESGLLRLLPDPTVRDLMWSLTLLRGAMLVLFGFVLLWVGVSPVVAFLLFFWALAVSQVQSSALPLSLYPFLLPAVLLLISLLTVVLRASTRCRRRVPWVLSGALLAGLLGGAIANLRTSYLPVVGAVFLLFLVFADGLRCAPVASGWRRRIGVAGLAVLMFVAGLRAFDGSFIRPLRDVGRTDESRDWHVIMHPLVLGLANPPSALSAREGIVWDDATGLTLARRVDPEATEMGPTYEKALFVYYVKLWGSCPGEMLVLYAVKLHRAGTPLFHRHGPVQLVLGMTPWCGVRYWIVDTLGPLESLCLGGWGKLAASVCVLIAAIIWMWRAGPIPVAFLVGALALVGVLLMLESAIIMPRLLAESYHGYLVFWFPALLLLAAQVAANRLIPACETPAPGDPPGNAGEVSPPAGGGGASERSCG